MPNLFSEKDEKQIANNLLPKDGMVEVHPEFFSQSECEFLLSHFIHDVEWKQETMKFYGKEVNIPRLTAWYGPKN